MVEEIKNDAAARMAKSIGALRHELGKIRTGRANASLLGHIMVSYYGSDVPLNQVATVTVSDPRTLAVSPWEKKISSPNREGDHPLGSRAQSGHHRRLDPGAAAASDPRSAAGR